MISSYQIDEFRQRLKALCDERTFVFWPVTFDPPVDEIFQPNRKPFYGEVNAHSFKLKRNSRFGTASYYIEGKYHELDGKTLVTFEFKRMVFEFYFIRGFPVFVLIIGNVLFISNMSLPLNDLLKMNLLISIFFLVIPLDNYFRKRLMKTLIDELGLSPTTPTK